MKILHTGDWHIGKIVNEFSMIEDQEFALEQMLDIIRLEKPDAVVIAGDIYDRSIPPIEAVELLDKIFSTILLELNTPILAIAGNHDSAERLSFASRVLTEKGLHIAGLFDKNIKKVKLTSDKCTTNFYLVPYADPREIKLVLEDDEILNHDEAMRKTIHKIKEGLEDNCKNVLVAHGYVANIKLDSEESSILKEEIDVIVSDSERPLSIGGTDIIRAEHFNCFHYTALGHLHSPQKIGSERMRYSGSLLKYSFSETKHKKGFTLVEFDENGEVNVRLIEVKPRRDMRIIRGPLNSLIDPKVYKDTNVEDYIYAILTDDTELIDPISKLRAVYPNIMGLSKDISSSREESRTSAAKGYEQKSKLDIFNEFYYSIHGRELDEQRIELLKSVMEEAERGER